MEKIDTTPHRKDKLTADNSLDRCTTIFIKKQSSYSAQ